MYVLEEQVVSEEGQGKPSQMHGLPGNGHSYHSLGTVLLWESPLALDQPLSPWGGEETVGKSQ